MAIEHLTLFTEKPEGLEAFMQVQGFDKVGTKQASSGLTQTLYRHNIGKEKIVFQYVNRVTRDIKDEYPDVNTVAYGKMLVANRRSEEIASKKVNLILELNTKYKVEFR